MRSVLLLIVYHKADAIKLAQLEKEGPAKPSRPPMLSPWMETQKPCCQEGSEKVVESSRDLWPAHSKAWRPVPIMLDAFPDAIKCKESALKATAETFRIYESCQCVMY